MAQDDGTLFPASERVQGQAESRRAYDDFLRRMEEFGWWQEYQELRGLGWDWRKAVYIAWAASPTQDRWPPTQEWLATEILGLKSDRTIRTWREKHSEIDEMVAALQAAPLLKHRRDIFDALAASASSPDFRHHSDRKLALEMMGDYKPGSHLDVEGKVVGMTLREWAAAAAQRRAQAEETLDLFDEEGDEEEKDA